MTGGGFSFRGPSANLITPSRCRWSRDNSTSRAATFSETLAGPTFEYAVTTTSESSSFNKCKSISAT